MTKKKKEAFDKAVKAFADEHGCYHEGRTAIESAIVGNAEQLHKIFKTYFK
jgi:hypothetical protein